MEGGLLRGVQRRLLRLCPDVVARRLGAVSHPGCYVPWGGNIWDDTEKQGVRPRGRALSLKQLHGFALDENMIL